MTCPRNAPTSPPHTSNTLPYPWGMSRRQFATCQIGCQPLSLPSPKRLPHRPRPTLLDVPQAQSSLGRGKKGHEHPGKYSGRAGP